jgi:ribosomal protein S18 acetylase RimI-like enzyme
MPYPLMEATVSILTQTTETINTAFMADSFFKKKEFYMRLRDSAELLDLMYGWDSSLPLAKASFILVASESPMQSNNNKTEVQHIRILGAVRVYTDGHNINEASQVPPRQAHFGMLSVPSEYKGRGIGKALVKACEAVAKCVMSTDSKTITMSIPVISERRDLIPFYQSLGYETVGITRPFEAPEILSEEYKTLGFEVMTKHLE